MSRHVTTMTIYDVEHYSDAERESIIASYPEHEREARAKGIPTMGSGRIFQVAEDKLAFDAVNFRVPDIWPQIAAIDFGWDHYTAVAWLAWDRDKDIVWLHDLIRLRQATPKEIAPLIIQRGDWIPLAWPADGLQTEKGSGIQLAEQYRQAGVNMLHEPASLPETGSEGEGRVSRYSVEAGVTSMLDAMKAGRFKVARHLHDWWEEFRLYHRKDGRIVREHDDAISASRYAFVSRRFAIVPPDNSSVLNPKRDYNWRI